MKIIPVNRFIRYFATPTEELLGGAARTTARVGRSTGLKMPEPLVTDVVSFHGTPKNLASRADDIPRRLAKQIHDIAAKRQTRVDDFITKLLGDMTVTEYNPTHVIESLKGRAKSTGSIIEKANSRGWVSKEEILGNMTDLNGNKIIMRDGSRSEVNKVLDRITKAVENRELEVVEIENKRPMVTSDLRGDDVLKYDYALPERLEKLVQDVESVQKHKVNYNPCDYTKTNYPALHFLFRFPGEKWVFEGQIMGHDVAIYKDLDDILYKILNNKNVDKKYKPIVDIIKPLNEPGNAGLKKQFNIYRSNVFLFQREKAPHITRHRTEHFLPIKDEIENDVIREKLDMNYLYELMLRCEGKIK